MNNLYRELAPVSAAAWADIEAEAERSFRSYVAARRAVDVSGPNGPTLSAIGSGHLHGIDPPSHGVIAHARESQPIIELRVPFRVDRQTVDDVERGAKDPDWQPVKDAARAMAFAEDRAVFDGYDAAGIAGIRESSTNPVLTLPRDTLDYPNVVSQALTALRLAGVDGPYSLLLSAQAYTEVSERSDHGYPIAEHLARVIDGDIVWAPAIDGAFVLSTRGGDYELLFGQDLSIGYLSHDAESVQLYFQESMTFFVYTAEAAVALSPPMA